MKIILCEDVNRLGAAGEIKKVADGYARNFLIPKKHAMEATASNMKRWEADSKAREMRLGKSVESAKKVASGIEKLGTLEVTAKVGREGHLFGSITALMIAAALKEKGIALDKKTIHITEPIKTLGEHEVSVKLHSQVTAALKVNVVSNAPAQSASGTAAAAPAETPAKTA